MGVGDVVIVIMPAVIIPMVGAIVWLVRIEGRVNGHDAQHVQHQKRHEELRTDIAYIRDRIDHALNGR